MPEIGRFRGILIRMFYDDHPPPHFHVKHGEHKAKIHLGTGELIVGHLPPKTLRLVQWWYHQHRDELRDNWQACQFTGPLKRIEPLP